ncbi:hypothetical protein M231_05501 [Tremella mesenterica]|uniref:Uncharacterized protein n=1 Tax=Tremella mesenterica TaxID=5217 RepID=A0A4Q1BHV4_TREME|nr:hypothetical protein M231_05501 [Tremella mesenterica]
MSSPIHKYLFSPPPSPPSLSNVRKPNFTPLNISSSLETQLCSPRTPQNSNGGFTLDTIFPSPYNQPVSGPILRTPKSSRFPYPSITISEPHFSQNEEDETENVGLVTPKATTQIKKEDESFTSKTRSISNDLEKSLNSTTNVNLSPTTLPIPHTLPRPLLRLLLLGGTVLACVLMLVLVPGARLPSLKVASVARRLKLDNDGRAYLDVARGGVKWEEEYVPPQVKVRYMMRRSTGVVPTKRTFHQPQPLPETHEFLALQSYLLQSSYASLPHTIDPSEPLDANVLLGLNKPLVTSTPHSHSSYPTDSTDPTEPFELSESTNSLATSNIINYVSSSDSSHLWDNNEDRRPNLNIGLSLSTELINLESERANDVVIWYGLSSSSSHSSSSSLKSSDIKKQPPKEIMNLLSKYHKGSRRPTLLSCHDRGDLPLLRSILVRLGLEKSLKDGLVVVIGNKPVYLSEEMFQISSNDNGNQIPKNDKNRVETVEEVGLDGKLGLEGKTGEMGEMELIGKERLEEMLKEIGWVKEQPKKKLNFAILKKKISKGDLEML